MTNEQLVWDCVEYKTIWEAEYAVKFPVFVPMVLETDHIERIAVIGKELVEVDYTNGIHYRTSIGTDDISGDYNKYEDENKFDISGTTIYHVTAKGYYGRIFLAIWTDDTYTFSIHVPHGVSQASLEILIRSLSQVNSCGTMANADMPNPIVEYDYIFEAEYAVDFGVAVPAVLGTDKIAHIYVISGKVVELNYQNDIVYRTARGDGDISGVYETYPYMETFEEGMFHVTVKGNMDLYYVSVWTGYGMTWSLYCPHGIHKKSLIKLIHSMKLVDCCNSASYECLSEKAIIGGYSSYHIATKKETAIFNEAMHFVGVEYEPLLVATQLVAGMNYRYLCNAKVIALDATPYLAQVTIFVSLPSGELKKPIITNIKRLD